MILTCDKPVTTLVGNRSKSSSSGWIGATKSQKRLAQLAIRPGYAIPDTPHLA